MTPDLLGVLAEPNRRRLLALLGAGEQSVTQLAAQFDVTRSAISQHLGVLMDAGLVEARQEGRYRYYRLVPEGLAALRTQIDHFWTAEVDALAQVGPTTAKAEPMDFDRSVFIPLPPDEAFALITEPDRLRRWKTVAARIDLRAGGDYRFTIVPGHIACGSVVEVDPGRRLVLSWGWDGDDDLPPGASTVTITLAPGDGGTFVRLVHQGLTDEQLVGHAEGWNHYLDRLVAFSTTGDAGPDEWAMAPDPIDELLSAEASLSVCQRVAATISPDDLLRPTPCTQFSIGQLVDHLLESLTHLCAAAGGTPPTGVEGSAEHRIAVLGSAAVDAWRARGLDGTVALGPAQLPAPVVASILTIELLVHAWDLATALGRPLETSPALAEYTLGLGDRLNSIGARPDDRFGPPVAVADEASALDRLVASTGRQP